MNEVISELKFNKKLKKIKPKNIFLKEVSKQLDSYFNKKLSKFDVPFKYQALNIKLKF